MNENIAVSFVIPTYNGRSFIDTCIQSIKEQTYTNYEIIVIDDASSDESVDYLRSTWHDIHVIQLQKNSGFCHAVNTGITSSSGKYVALINNDIELDPNWLESMIAAIQTQKNIFSISSKILNFHERDKIDDAGDIYTREGRAFKRGYGQHSTHYMDRGEVFSSSGAASLFDADILKNVGLFDESFTAYLDDVDIGFRARLMGYKNYYEPNAIAYHMGSMSYRKKSIFMGSLILKNSMAVIVKNIPSSLFWRFFPWLITGHLKTVKYVFSISGFRGVFRGYGMFLKMLPAILIARKDIQRTRAVSTDALKNMMYRCYDQKTGKITTFASRKRDKIT